MNPGRRERPCHPPLDDESASISLLLMQPAPRMAAGSVQSTRPVQSVSRSPTESRTVGNEPKGVVPPLSPLPGRGPIQDRRCYFGSISAPSPRATSKRCSSEGQLLDDDLHIAATASEPEGLS